MVPCMGAPMGDDGTPGCNIYEIQTKKAIRHTDNVGNMAIPFFKAASFAEASVTTAER